MSSSNILLKAERHPGVSFIKNRKGYICIYFLLCKIYPLGLALSFNQIQPNTSAHSSQVTRSSTTWDDDIADNPNQYHICCHPEWDDSLYTARTFAYKTAFSSLWCNIILNLRSAFAKYQARNLRPGIPFHGQHEQCVAIKEITQCALPVFACDVRPVSHKWICAWARTSLHAGHGGKEHRSYHMWGYMFAYIYIMPSGIQQAIARWTMTRRVNDARAARWIFVWRVC